MTVCCSVLQCVAARIRLPGILASIVWPWGRSDLCVAVCLQCIAVCRSASRLPGMVCSIFLKKKMFFIWLLFIHSTSCILKTHMLTSMCTKSSQDLMNKGFYTYNLYVSYTYSLCWIKILTRILSSQYLLNTDSYTYKYACIHIHMHT